MRLLRHDRSLSSNSIRFQLSTRWSISVPTSVLIVSVLSALYLLAVQYYRLISCRDPTSFFFDPTHAYDKLYSSQRIVEAESYIRAADGTSTNSHTPSNEPLICVGIATVARRGDQYVSLTTGSLLAGLSKQERDRIFLNILVAHTEPTSHPNADDSWIKAYPDRVLNYRTEDYDQIKSWVDGGWYRNKTIFDYTYLLKSCYDTGAKYVLMVEDDVIAAEDWFPRALRALEVVETAMQTRSSQHWVYLRLFYADDLLGWNSEEWPKYLFWSFSAWSTFTGLLVLARRKSKLVQELCSSQILLVISCIFAPAAIALHFMAGRQTMWPISVGVHEMNKYGCCSQGLLYPREIIPSLLVRTDLVTDWLVDMMVETIADKESWIRWVTVPSLLQHIGATSSKGYGFDDNAKSLWNFRFEQHRSTDWQ